MLAVDALWVIVGVGVGLAGGYLLVSLRGRRERDLAKTLIEEAQSEKLADLNAIVDQLKTAFAALSRDALSKNTDDFLKLAKTRLDQQTVVGSEQLESKKKLIDSALESMNTKLKDLTALTQSVDKDRREGFGALKTDLAKTAEATGKLRETTAQLREALASSQARGQWGERMAEDVLRLAGFVEGVNYTKQKEVASGERPDFTFMLPKALKLNMDVKFPLANYLRALEAEEPTARQQYEKAFLRDVRKQIKDVTSRAYIDPEGGTVDCVLVFIPNEQIYGYIHEHDTTLMDDALKQKVVLCSPLTLYAVLAVVRQSVDNFRLEQTSHEILSLLGAFRGEWRKYCEVVEKTEKALDQAVKQFGLLTTTRTRKLERQLDRIEDLRQAKGVALPPDADASDRVDDRPLLTEDES